MRTAAGHQPGPPPSGAPDRIGRRRGSRTRNVRLPKPWPGTGGPGTVSGLLIGGELAVLTSYLTVGLVLDRDPLMRAMTGGVRLWLVGLWTATVLLLAAGDCYRQRLSLSVWEELPALAPRLGLPLVAVVAAADRVAGPAARNALVVLGLAGVASQLVVRSGMLGLIRRNRQERRSASRTLVMGGGTVSGKAVDLLESLPEYGLLVLGYVDDLPAPLSAGPAGWTYLGSVDELPDVVRRLRIQAVVVGFGAGSDALTARALRRLGHDVRVYTVPRLFEFGRRPLGQDHAGPIPLTRVRRAVRRGPRWALKRTFDVVVAGGALLLAAPVTAVLALAVRLEGGPGPVVVGHRRVGRNGEPLLLWRFRTARPGRGPGPVGRLLRRCVLGRLPTLWNVLVGQLSVVGPAPATVQSAARLHRMLPHYEDRLQVRGGLVAPAAAAEGTGTPTAEECVLYDTSYVENWGPWTDATVLVHGLRRLLTTRRRGVR